MKKGQRKQGICVLCKKSYYKYKKKMMYCSVKCFSSVRKTIVNDEYKEKIKIRIIQKSKIDLVTGCWNWLKYKDKLGRGYCHFQNTTIQAHRASFIAFKNDILKGLVICHKCDNYSCVNPDHLFMGTQQDNVDDREEKKRGIKGEKVANSRLKEEMIPKIRKLYENGMTQKEISILYNVAQTTISAIITKTTWSYI